MTKRKIITVINKEAPSAASFVDIKDAARYVALSERKLRKLIAEDYYEEEGFIVCVGLLHGSKRGGGPGNPIINGSIK